MSTAGPPRYVDLGSFARGGFASLHRVEDTQLRRILAMKVLDAKFADRPVERARFLREARVTSLLEHPGVVPVHELGEYADGRAWFTMKFINGQTLGVAIRRGAELRALVDALLRVCETMAFAHDRGVFHRDIKPENVMLGAFGEVYVMDWGIAVVPGEEPAGVAGTPSWLAPEQARGEPADARTDVYGIGGLLYYALCHARPHPGETSAERLASARGEPVRPPQDIVPGLPPELCRTAMRALEFDPKDRYPSVAALRADIDAAVRGGWWLETCVWHPGTAVVREGDPATAAWIILEGRALVLQGGRVVNELGPGDAFGELALLCGEPRMASVIAKTELVARVIRAEVLESTLRDAWLGPVVRQLVERIRDQPR